MKKIISLIVTFLCLSYFSFGTTYFVNDNSPANDIYTTAAGNNTNIGSASAPFATLDYVVNTIGLVPGDSVFIDAGYYYQTDANLAINVDNVAIIGAGSDVTTFDNDQGSADSNRWGVITGNNVTIQGIGLTGYNYGFGGASALQISGVTGVQIIDLLSDENKPGGGASSIVVDGGSQVDFIDGGANCNTAASVAGGGVNVEGNGNTVTFTNYSFSNNSKDWQGGSGLYVSGDNTSNVSVVNSIFADNNNGSASGGGAVFLSGANLTIDSCCFSDNTAFYTGGPVYGGAICVARGATLNIAHCSFANNEAQTSGKGGAIGINTSFSGSGSAAVVNVDSCSFSGNVAGEAADLYARVGSSNPATYNINECSFSGTTLDLRDDNSAIVNIQNSGSPNATGAGINFINSVSQTTIVSTNCPSLVGSCYTAPCVNSTPTGVSAQSFCVNPTPTVNDLVAIGGTIVWYDAAVGGNPYFPNETLVDGQSYFAADETVGCDPSGRFEVVVTLIDQADAGTLSGTSGLCEGSTSSITTTGDTGGTWTSSDPLVATVDASGLVTAVGAGSTTITYEVSAASPCTVDDQATLVITVTASADAGTLSGTSSLCEGSTSNIATTGDAGGTWTSSDPLVATVDAIGLVTAIGAGSTTITYEVSATSPCTVDDQATLVVTVMASADAGTLTGNSSLCEGSTSNIISTGDAGGTWTSSDPLVAAVDASGLVTAVAAGSTTITYEVSATSPCTVDDQAIIVITVTASADAGTLSGTSSLCEGSTSNITSTGDAGGTWTSSDPLVATVDASGLVTAVGAGSTTITYEVSATSPCTVDDQATIVITVTAAPNAGLDGVLNICVGDPFTNSDLFNALGGTPDVGGIWSNSGMIYTYTVLGTGGCTFNSTAEVVVTESDTTAPSGSNIQLFCFDSYPQVSDLLISGNNINWYSDAALTNVISIFDTLIDGNTYYATQTSNLSGCESSSSFDVLVTLSDPQLDSSQIIINQSNCGNSDGSISGVTVSGGIPNYDWSWFSGSTQVSNTQDLTNQPSGLYTLVVTDAIGCQDSIEALIITDAGAADIDASAVLLTDESCDASNGSISGILVSGGAGTLSYEWSNGTGVVSTIQTPNSLTAGTYTLTVTDVNGCVAQAGPFVLNNLTGPVLDLTNMVLLDASCNEANGSITGIQISGNGPFLTDWTDGNNVVSDSIDVQDLFPGSYSLVVTDTNGCSIQLDTNIISNPMITLNAQDDFTSTDPSTAVSLDIGANDTGDVSTIVVSSGPINGTVSIDNLGVMTYLPNDGFFGSDSFIYTICDEFCNLVCTTAVVTIDVEMPVDITIPNGFSPNGDGFNDTWVIEGLEAFPENEVIIFNRWGDQVFDAKPYLNNWDGTSNNNSLKLTGNQVTDGTYYFILNLNSDGFEPINGFIELRRE